MSTEDTQPGDPPPGDHGRVPRGPFPVVALGASAGGLAALEAFFAALPADAETGMAFVVVQHLSPHHKSILTDLVSRQTRMRVTEVSDGMVVHPDTVYVIPPNREMTFSNGILELQAFSGPKRSMSIDHFLISLARGLRDRTVAVVLSGTGTDGSLGARVVKAEGGLVMVQDPASADFDGMPRSAIATASVDFVLVPEQMPAALLQYASQAFGTGAASLHTRVAGAEHVLRQVCNLLHERTGRDFSQYKRNTLLRRVERRMAIRQLDLADDYLRDLQGDPGELDALYRDMLIGVTGFFRDPEAFEALQGLLGARLAAQGSSDEAFRVWVCGCSTGEEAYSLAILLRERLDALGASRKLQIFATDIDGAAIEQARGGTYPLGIEEDLTSERLSRFFVRDADAGTYTIHKAIRDQIVFSEQDVIKDPPFSKLDLISCRNLLIYMNGDLQRRLIPLFHYSLRPQGLLFLGTSETVGDGSTLFEPVDRRWKVYRRREASAALPAGFGGQPRLAARELPAAMLPERRADRGETLRALTERAMLEHFSVAGVLVNPAGEILHIYGRTGEYLEPVPGVPGLNVIAMAREGLRREITIALHRAVHKKQEVHEPAVRVKTNGDFALVDLTVRPVVASELSALDAYLVIFEPRTGAIVEEAATEDATIEGTEGDARVNALEQELRAKEEYLQTALEEMETSNEELKSANEEMQSVNEELQSTNEELETSKEELQSVNEELATVNAELQTKVTELSRANNDMNNLLAGTGVGTIFVDMQLRIVRFTPTATRVLNLIDSDVGRPIGHLVSKLVGQDGLENRIQRVLDTLVAEEGEVETTNGTWYLMRVGPYRTLENVIEGVVLTFVDVARRKQAEAALRRAKGPLPEALQTVPAALLDDGKLSEVNDAFAARLGIDRDSIVGKDPEALGDKALSSAGTVEIEGRRYELLLCLEDAPGKA